jgi:hypothetical protein
MLLNTADKLYVGSALVAKVYLGTVQVWPSSGAAPVYSAMQFDAIFTALQVIGRR